jgi:hypothetical protein
MPYVGARYGFAKTNAALARAAKDIATGGGANWQSGWDAAKSKKLTDGERQAIKTLQDEGVIDLTQAHDLASATGLDSGSVARSRAAFAASKAMRIVGWTFHIPEVMNRQTSALAAYRLEVDKSGNVETALQSARDALARTHFDYSSSNRPRYMQGNWMRVITQFKLYAQNMTYFLARAFQQAVAGESPEVKKIAAKQLGATLAIHWAMAGVAGLPVIGFLGGILSMFKGGDDDEPWDWEIELRNKLADAVGKEHAEWIMKGLPRGARHVVKEAALKADLPPDTAQAIALAFSGDLSSRVSIGDLWFRGGPREGDNPREQMAAYGSMLLGPTFGTALSMLTAGDHFGRGNWAKGVESMSPKFVKDPIKAWRESTDGVTSYSGEPLLDLTASEAMVQALGFTPSRKSEMFSARAAVNEAKRSIEVRRQVLVALMARAELDGKGDAKKIEADIDAFNDKHPEFTIDGETIASAIETRQANREKTVDGILVPDTKQSLRDKARFAVTQP